MSLKLQKPKHQEVGDRSTRTDGPATTVETATGQSLKQVELLGREPQVKNWMETSQHERLKQDEVSELQHKHM